MSKISILSPEFSDMRDALDWGLQKAVEKMQHIGADEAAVTLKVNILLSDREIAGEMVQVPSFAHEVKNSLQIKSSVKGHLRGDYALVFDKTTRKYEIRPVDDGQMEIEE